MRPPLRTSAAALVLVLCGLTSLRAQVTEVPQTLEPGHALMRVNAISVGLAQDTAAPNQYKALGLGTVLVAAGITDTVDFEIGTQLYSRSTFSSGGADETHSGIGSVMLRPKWAFWKDPVAGEAAAIIPYATIPSHSHAVGSGSVQGGVILTWSKEVPNTGVRAGAMFEWDELRNQADTRYDTRWYSSGYVKWELGRLLSAYAESTVSDSTAGSSSFAGTLGGGVTVSVSKNFEWDFAMSKVLGPGRNAWSQSVRFRWHLF